ncbi:hypothetical protein OAM96_01115 [Candidatus Poseidoniaceae archaeon]|nr:hypothetical protein [Candidatus Poseidoniaceae archaeon]
MRDSSTNISTLLAGLILLVLLTPNIAPFTSASDGARANPDFSVQSITLDGAGSVWDGVDLVLEQEEHIVRIVVANTGSAAGQVILSLVHRGSPTAGETTITSVNLGTMSASSTSNPILISWNATTGDSQTLFARVAPSSATIDTNSANNEQRLDFNVRVFHSGAVTGETIPVPTGGQSTARLTNAVHPVTATVLNQGVMAMSAAMELSFFEISNPANTFTLWSNTVTLEPGSLLNPAIASVLNTNLDATSITGIWNLTATVHFNGTAYTDPQIISEVDVEFSNFVAELTTPSDRTTEPGMQTTLTYIVKNTDTSSDSFVVSISDVLGWADKTRDGASTPVISPNGTHIEEIVVTVPIGASRALVESITLTLTSVSASYTLTGMARVMSGEHFSASVSMPAGVTLVTPGQEVELSVQITNDGNVPATFNLNSGLGVLANNWTLSLSSTSTTVVNDGSTVTVVLTVVVPPIQLPLDASEYNRAGDSINVWVQAQATGGGLPAIGFSAVEVKPIIVVDPGLPTEHIELTVQDVIDAKNGMGFDEILGLNVEVRHNLVSDISETLDVTINASEQFFTADNTGGFEEAERWNSSVTPTTLTGLIPGEIRLAALGIQGPASNEYPLAGTIRIPVTAYPSLGLVHSGSGIEAVNVTRNLTITIPRVLGGEIIEQGPLNATVGIKTDFGLNLSNIGNDLTSYRLTIVDDLPDNWIATLNTTTPTSNTIDNLSADVSDWSLTSGVIGDIHLQEFTLSVTTDPQASADISQPLSIIIEERDTGFYIDTHTINISVNEVINASLSPTNQSVDLSAYETQLTRVIINNTGNAPTNFNLWLDDSNSADVDFTLESPDNLLIADGYESSVKIRINPSEDASFDELYMATLWVSTDSGLNLSANIVANISEEHLLEIDAPSQIAVVPGTNQDVAFNLTNIGNLVETVTVTIGVEGNWTVTPPTQQFTLPIDAVVDGTVIVEVPSLGGSDDLLNGAVHNMTITVTDSVTEATLGVRSVELVVGALFLVEADNWPDEMLYHRQWERTWNVILTNTGNDDVTVSIDYDILLPGLTINSDAWELSEGAVTTLTLPRQSAIPYSFSVSGTEFEPDLTLAADLVVILTPLDETIEGTAELRTTLKMSRFFEATPIELRPPADDGPMEVDLVYSHIPSVNSSIVAYELEMCSAVRLIEVANLDLNPDDYVWNFTVYVDTTVHYLSLNASCATGSQGNSSRISLPPRAAWDTSAPIRIIVDAPNRPNILPGDGYDLTFRLYHPDENVGYTIFTEETFTFALDVFSDPEIGDIEIVEGKLIEGTEAIISVDVKNGGTALALGVRVDLVCDNLNILESPPEIFLLGPNSEETLTFRVESINLDWWAQSLPVECTASLNGTLMHKNIVANDVGTYEGNVESFSWGLSISFIATVVLMIISLFLINLSSKNEKMRLVAVYTGVAALGFAFHIGQAFSLTWWGPAILALTALWVWRMTWSCSEEFRLIHEDYQRARRGVSTMYADHFEALADGRRQLSLILALPIFGMMGIVLGVPPQMASDRTNLVSLVVYMAVIMIGVWILLSKSDKMYGNLFGRLTDVEVKATRIERDLGDPARLLNELADEGLDLTAIFEGVSTTTSVSDIIPDNNNEEGVNDDV